MTLHDAIPIVVGVTGHRDIRPEDRDILSEAVKTELRALRDRCPHSGIVMLNSLAAGADQLCAAAALELSVPLIAVLPMDRAEYEKDFSGDDLAAFRTLLDAAEDCFIAPETEAAPSAPDRDFAYRQAGIYVASRAHVLLALWDGTDAPASNCGTAEAVRFALDSAYEPKHTIPLGGSCPVLHIRTPRRDGDANVAGEVRFLGDRASFDEVLLRTDEFNRLAADTDVEGAARLPTKESDPLLVRMERIGKAAGRLSAMNAKRLRLTLGLLAVASAMVAFAFLMYDEAQATWMILVCGLMLLGAWLCQRYAARSDCHRRYIEYRALAECLRVQTYLRYAGSRIEASELLSWTQQEETAWIMDALCALNAGEAPETAHDIRSCWVNAQREYHHRAGIRSDHGLQVSGRIVRSALIFSITLYFAAVVFELICGGLIFSPLVRIGNVELCRTILKIVMGTITAVTLFVANYYGRLSLPRSLSDHRKMERFYARMAERLSRQGQTEELLRVLAREELIENGNWSSYQRDNTPDLNL